MDSFAFDPDETRSGFGGEVGASSDETGEGVESAPPPRARPALRADALPPERTGALENEAARAASARSAPVGSVSGRRRVVSRRMRVRSGGVRRSRLDSSSSGDHRAASGRHAPASPGRREPHPRAVSGPPRPQANEAGESGEVSRSARRRRVLSSHGFPAFGQSPGLDEVLGDEPILVVDSLPPRRLFGEDTSRFSLRRTVRLRFDMALAAALVVATMVGSAFYLGRQGTPEGAARVAVNPGLAGRSPAALSLGTRGPGLSRTRAPAVPRRERTSPHAARSSRGGVTNGGAVADRSASGARTAPVAAAPQVSIMAMRSQRRRADEVKRFLESQGLRVYLQHVNARTTNVRVGGYTSWTSEAAKADLKRVRGLVFEGKKLGDAYFVPWKSGL